MDKDINPTLQDLKIHDLKTQISETKNKNKNEPYDEEPLLFHGIGMISFATVTILLAIRQWNGFPNQKLLTIFGFVIGGCGQFITAIMCYKNKYYIDGTCYFYFFSIG